MVRRDLTAALLDFDLCVNLNPNDAVGYNGRGSVHFLQGKFKDAVNDYNRAIQLMPTDARSRSQRGYAYAALGEPDKAMADFEEALKLNPKEGAALLGRAELRRTKKDWSAALADYEAALAIAPDDFRGLLGRAATYFGSGAYDKALTAYVEVEKRYPDEPQPFNDHAWLLATGTQDGLRDGNRAIELASRACELTKWENPAYLDTLAAAYAEKGDFAAALKWQELAVKLSEKEPPEVQTDIKSRIALYTEKKPYREALK
jgi:tetratricopeptide (TPR) repeat protein